MGKSKKAQDYDLEYDIVFKNFNKLLRFGILHPDIKRNFKWYLHFITNQGFVTFVFLLMSYNAIYVNLKAKDFSETCKNAALSVVYCETSFQYFIYFWKETHILWLTNRMKADYALVKQRPTKELEIMKDFASRAARICKAWLALPCIILGWFPVLNITSMAYYVIMGDPHLIAIYELVYPDFIETRKEDLYMYMITYVVLLNYGLSSVVAMSTFAPLGPTFMLHACGLLDVLKVRIEVLFKEYTLQEIKTEVKEVAKQLQYIYSYVDRINICFTVAYEITFKATTIMLPITCYEVLESLKHGELSMEFISLIVGGVGLNSTLCFYSDLLLEKGEGVREAVYMCGWEKKYDQQIRSSLMVILLRAQQPIAIRTLFHDVCLITLTDLMNQSYGLFNLMNAAWD